MGHWRRANPFEELFEARNACKPLNLQHLLKLQGGAAVAGDFTDVCNIEQSTERVPVLVCRMLSNAARRVSAQAASAPPGKAIFRDSAFDVQRFLDSAGIGRKITKFRNKERIFAQGDAARNVRYIHEGGVKLTVVNEAGKEAVVAILGPSDF